MDAGGLAQMSSNNFAPQNGLAMPGGGLAARRGGQNVKPLSFDALKQAKPGDNGAPTPRTSRSHLLAGLRTAPKTAMAATFGPQSPTTNGPVQQFARNPTAGNAYGMNQDNVYNNAPKTAFPQYGAQSSYGNMMSQQYTVDQVLAPPELGIDEQAQEHMDPNLYAQLVATNLYLAQQQQRLQQQLRSVQAAAQQFQQLNLNNPQLTQQQMAIYEQQQQLRNMQQQLGMQAALSQQQAQQTQQQVYYNPMTGQYYVENPAAAQMSAYMEQQQPMSPGFGAFQQQLQQNSTPSVQVSPPQESQPLPFRSNSPPKRYDSPTEVTPLPPPSANAFRRGHKKANSLAPLNSALAATASTGDVPKTAGPKTATFPSTPATGSYGPGQGRAGEHPIRQPRGPPSLDELKSKPTAKIEGSKNFATRTRRSAVHNLVQAGLERRKGSGSSCGSMSPVSEVAEEETTTPITDNESDSGRSGSGSLAGEMECASSRTSASSWGAIGSDRPSSRQKARKSVDSVDSASEGETSSFANVFKNGALRAAKAQESADGQRKAPRLVLTKTTPVV